MFVCVGGWVGEPVFLQCLRVFIILCVKYYDTALYCHHRIGHSSVS